MGPINHKTKVCYSGSNHDTLNHVMMTKGYRKNEWITFIQAKEIGLNVRKGEQGTKLLRLIELDNKKTKQKERVVRTFTVFNIEQTEKLD